MEVIDFFIRQQRVAKNFQQRVTYALYEEDFKKVNDYLKKNYRFTALGYTQDNGILVQTYGDGTICIIPMPSDYLKTLETLYAPSEYFE